MSNTGGKPLAHREIYAKKSDFRVFISTEVVIKVKKNDRPFVSICDFS